VNAEIGEDLCTETVIAEIHRETQPLVGLDGVEALLLEFVGAYLGSEADAAALLAHVEQNACAFLFDALHGLVELGTAIAAAGGKNIAR
jgi:hypothetical protein